MDEADFDFADDVIIFAETIEVLAEALQSLSEEAEPFRLRVSWMKTMVQPFADILKSIFESISVSGENKKITQTFT